jgi:hypothetical protein
VEDNMRHKIAESKLKFSETRDHNHRISYRERERVKDREIERENFGEYI